MDDVSDYSSSESLTSDEEVISAAIDNLKFDVNLFWSPTVGPPPPDVPETEKNDNMRVLRIIHKLTDEIVSFRHHSELQEYLHMDAVLQKFYTMHEREFRIFHPITKNNIIWKGYYVVKLGNRFERCQYLYRVLSEKVNSYRIRLLDYGVPLMVPVNILRPMHEGFKKLRPQGCTGVIYDADDGKDLAIKRIGEEYMNRIYLAHVMNVNLSYKLVPHLHVILVKRL